MIAVVLMLQALYSRSGHPLCEPQKPEVSDPLHTVPDDEQGWSVCFIFPVVYDQLLSLGSVQCVVSYLCI